MSSWLLAPLRLVNPRELSLSKQTVQIAKITISHRHMVGARARLRSALGLGLGLSLMTCLAGIDHADAEIILAVDKSKQSMTVIVDGVEQHVWTVSTGSAGGPRNGIFHPKRLERRWFSRKYNMAPMPHAIFFYEGYAIHGTNHVAQLGRRASHGCVRLHPSHAELLFELVRSRRMRDTTIVVSNSEYVQKPRVPKPPYSMELANAPDLPIDSPISLSVNFTLNPHE